MSSTRAIRGTKIKVLLLLLACVVVAGILTGVNNTLTQVTDLKESNGICQQHVEKLSTQLQVITDYKQRLEKSLKNEKSDNQQKRQELESQYKQEKVNCEKQINSASTKFDSLQQHFNLLQTNYDDFKLKQQAKEDKLEETIKDLKAQIQSLTTDKEHLKTKVLEVEVERDEIKQKMDENKFDKTQNESELGHLQKENNELQRELEQLRSKCPNYETLQEPSDHQVKSSSAKTLILGADMGKGVMNVPPVASSKAASSSPSGLQPILPPNKGTTKSGMQSSKGSLNGARPIKLPTVTSESSMKSNLADDGHKIKVPEGVVPIPDEKANEVDNDGINSRYRNAVEGNQQQKPKVEVVEKENSAHDVLDPPNEIEKPKENSNNAAGYDGGLSFNENEQVQQKPNFEKQHIDNLGVAEQDVKLFDQEKPADYNDLQNDVPLEENDPEEDDEQDEYGAMRGRNNKEPAIRN